MKHLYTLILVTNSLLLLTACGSSSPVAPSQNDALNKISNSKGKEKSSYMQQGLDTWLEEEWKPAVEKDEEIQAKYMQKLQTPESDHNKTQQTYVEKVNKPFTLQEYADKADAYFKVQERDLEDSHAEKIKKMPVIGK